MEIQFIQEQLEKWCKFHRATVSSFWDNSFAHFLLGGATISSISKDFTVNAENYIVLCSSFVTRILFY